MELLDGDQRPRLDVFVDVKKLMDLVRIHDVIAVLVFEKPASTSLSSRRLLVTRIVCLRRLIVTVVRIWLQRLGAFFEEKAWEAMINPFHPGACRTSNQLSHADFVAAEMTFPRSRVRESGREVLDDPSFVGGEKRYTFQLLGFPEHPFACLGPAVVLRFAMPPERRCIDEAFAAQAASTRGLDLWSVLRFAMLPKCRFLGIPQRAIRRLDQGATRDARRDTQFREKGSLQICATLIRKFQP